MNPIKVLLFGNIMNVILIFCVYISPFAVFIRIVAPARLQQGILMAFNLKMGTECLQGWVDLLDVLDFLEVFFRFKYILDVNFTPLLRQCRYCLIICIGFQCIRAFELQKAVSCCSCNNFLTPHCFL